MTDTTGYQLIIFDMDGTLSEWQTGELLPGVADYFADLDESIAPHFALATNQGGVGLRMLMEQDNFGEPAKFPTESDIRDHIDKVMHRIDKVSTATLSFFTRVCFAFKTRKGGISPIPRDHDYINEWQLSHRKPNPGMLLDAIEHYGVSADNTLMVGDRPEDRAAARKAHCDFIWAWEFFGRDEPEEMSK